MELHDFDEDHLKLVLRDDDEEEDESFRREQPLPFSASTLGASLIRPTESPSLKEPKEDRYKLLPEYAKPNSARGNAAVQVEVIIGEKRVSLSDHEEKFLPDGMLTVSAKRDHCIRIGKKHISKCFRKHSKNRCRCSHNIRTSSYCQFSCLGFEGRLY